MELSDIMYHRQVWEHWIQLKIAAKQGHIGTNIIKSFVVKNVRLMSTSTTRIIFYHVTKDTKFVRIQFITNLNNYNKNYESLKMSKDMQLC